MPILIVDQHGIQHAAAVSGRVYIGRRPPEGISIDEPAVARLHAWIDSLNGHYFIADTGSKGGTFLNNQRLRGRRQLADGDEIQIGTAVLMYLQTDVAPRGIPALDLGKPAEQAADEGIFFNCVCGAPIWVASQLAGRTGTCRQCGQPITVPSRRVAVPQAPGPRVSTIGNAPLHAPVSAGAGAPAIAPPEIRPARRRPGRGAPAVAPGNRFTAPLEDVTADAAAASEMPVEVEVATDRVEPEATRELPSDHAITCSICQCAIVAGEEHTSCPECHLIFHADCWSENYGCSAYGCSQVNALIEKTEEELAESGAALDELQRLRLRVPVPSLLDDPGNLPASSDAPAFPWDYLLLAMSVFAALVSALAFGAPSLLLTLILLIYLIRRPGSQRLWVVLTALGLSIVGIAIGLATSSMFWYAKPVWQVFHR
ncbi:MAG TPA: FHA domain-containing protein [Tepidisphaeraceae bacterium]|jgi:hypothetical protein